MIKKEWLFMQTPKEKAYQLAKAFYVETTTSTEAKQCAKATYYFDTRERDTKAV